MALNGTSTSTITITCTEKKRVCIPHTTLNIEADLARMRAQCTKRMRSDTCTVHEHVHDTAIHVIGRQSQFFTFLLLQSLLCLAFAFAFASATYRCPCRRASSEHLDAPVAAVVSTAVSGRTQSVGSAVAPCRHPALRQPPVRDGMWGPRRCSPERPGHRSRAYPFC